MTKQEVLSQITEIGIVPVIRAPSTDLALRAVEAVLEAGVSVLEITLTVPDALTLINSLSIRFEHRAILGAGSVLTAESAQQCADAGAKFIVSPGLNVEMVEAMKRRETLMVAGALTPTEVMAALAAEADLIKVFPCSALGGARYLKALRGPLPQVKLIPTGGVNADTAADFIRAGATALGVGSELVDMEALQAGKDDEITRRARTLVRIVQEARRG
jgi:2-dehydro-3-deoxyphosphogluconate aldolase/(4S)-4-hydroxy-2-oxoglutarate aldolase